MTHRDAFDQDIQIIAGDGISIAQTGTKQITISAGGSVNTWLKPSAQTVPDNTVLVQPGKYTRSTGVRLVDVPAALTSPAFATVTTGNKRCDLLQISDLGALSIKQGAEIPAATIIDPATHWPTLEADKLAIAIVLVTEDTTVVVDATDITDVREYLNKVGTASGGAGVDAKQNGSLILAGATAINFKGGVTVSDAGGGQADVEIEGGTVAARDVYSRGLVVTNCESGMTGDQVRVKAGVSVIAANGNAEITVASDLTIDGSAVGLNGLDTGALAPATWYAIYLIKNPFTAAVRGVLSMNFVTPNLANPAFTGYTLYRRVGSVYREREVWTLVDRFGTFSNWNLAGVVAGNSFGGVLYGELNKSGANYLVNVYKYPDNTGLVAQSAAFGSITPGTVSLAVRNASGISGTVDVDATALVGSGRTRDANVVIKCVDAGERFVKFFQTEDQVYYPSDTRLFAYDSRVGKAWTCDPAVGTPPGPGFTTARAMPVTAKDMDVSVFSFGFDSGLHASTIGTLDIPANQTRTIDNDYHGVVSEVALPSAPGSIIALSGDNNIGVKNAYRIPIVNMDETLYVYQVKYNSPYASIYGVRCEGYRDAVGSLLGGIGAVTDIHTRTFDVGTEVSATQGAAFITALSAPIAAEFVEGAPVKITDGAATVYCIVESVAGLQINLFGPDLTALGALTGVQQGDTERVRSLDFAAGQLWAEAADVGFNILSTVGHRRYFWQYGLAAFVYGSAVAASVATTGGGLTVTAGGTAVSDEVLIQNTLTPWTAYAATQADVETGDEIELILGTADAGSTWLSGALNFVLQW